MRISVIGQLQHMAEPELLRYVPKDTIARIKQGDEHPEFRAYAIAHEGISEPKMVGGGGLLLKYFRDAIYKIHDKLELGTPVFHGHNADNSTDGRETIGEIVGKTLREIGGKLYDIAVTYIKPEHRSAPLDVASFEAEVGFNPNADGETCTAVDVGEITGLALGSSAVERPAFSGATLLAAVQAFVSKDEGKGNNAMTLEELKAACKELKVKPVDLFDAEDLLKVPEVKEKLDLTGREAARRVRTEEVTEVSQKLKEITVERDTLKTQLLQGKAKNLFDTLSTERKLSDPQKAFAARDLDAFKTSSTDDDGLKRDLNAHIDKKLTEYSEVAKILGVEVKSDSGSLPGNPAADPAGAGGNLDYTNPEQNPL